MSGYGRRSSNRRRIGWSGWLSSNPARASWRFRAAPAWSHGRLQPWWAAPGQVIATDISERMVERTAAEATRRGLSQVACRRMDAETIDEADASFDAVVCALGLMYVPEVATALGEMYRVRSRRVVVSPPLCGGRGPSAAGRRCSPSSSRGSHRMSARCSSILGRTTRSPIRSPARDS